jgi:8-oxo-dGTP pyrophosphatase MutT (NUDIX family)
VTTWDGLPVSDDKPHGATVVVFRRGSAGPELLMLHRAHSGPDYEGDWAWTPPAGARLPDESIAACAERELREEAGLHLPMLRTDCGSEDWYVYVAEAPADALVTVAHDPEHDRYAWLSPDQAIACCRPDLARESLRAAVDVILRAPRTQK